MIQTTIGVGGMMCSMCEAHINDAIRRAFDVKSAKSNRKTKQCVVVSASELDKDQVRKVIEELGYEFCGMECGPVQKRGLLGSLFANR